MKAEVISIGSELTSGQNLDTNAQWLSRRLAEAAPLIDAAGSAPRGARQTTGRRLDDAQDQEPCAQVPGELKGLLRGSI